jgi:oligopeptide transport system substrate-binding protein
MLLPKRARWLPILVAFGLLVAACGGGGGGGDEGGGGSQGGGSFSIYIGEPENPLVPQNTTESEGSLVLSALFRGLVEYDQQTSEPVNVMAESIESPDQQNWTIKIKPGWTFHNGEPITAQSFVDAWNHGAYGENAYEASYFFENVKGYDDLQCGDEKCTKKPKTKEMSGLKKVDDTTFTVALKEPFSAFPVTLGYNVFYPLPKAFFSADPKKWGDAPVGNGPFQMDGTWKHNQSIKVKKYAGYKGPDAAKADALEFRIYSEVNTAYRDAQGGNLDIVDQVPPEQIEAAKTEFEGRYVERPTSSLTFLGMPTYDPKFAKKELRQALSLAIDRDAITKTIFNGTRKPARSIVSPVVIGYREDACPNCQYDPAKAKQLLQKAGGWTGTMTLWFNSGAGHEEWMEAVANQLRTNLGIQTKFQTLDFAQYLPRLEEKKATGPYRLGWIMDYPNAQNYLQPIFSTTGSSNYSGYANKAFDDLVKKGNAAKTPEESVQLYHQAEDLLLDDLPVIPMFFGTQQAVHSDRVSNVKIDAFARIRLAEVTVKQ